MRDSSSSSNPAEPEKVPPGSVSTPGAVGSEGAASTSDGAEAADAGAAAAGRLDEAAAGIDRESLAQIETIVGDFLRALGSMNPDEPGFDSTIASLSRLGERDFVATAAMSGRLLDRRFGAMSGLLAARAPMARQLEDLRKAATGLDPARLKFGGSRTRRSELDELARYFERFNKSRERIEGVLTALNEGRSALERDNAAISFEQRALAHEMETLRQYAFLAARLDDEIAGRIDAIGATDSERADELRRDLLTVVRRRRQEILTQLAIATQGYAALEIVEENNEAVVQAIAEATNSTAAALRTAVMVAQAAATQRVTLERLSAAADLRETLSEIARRRATQQGESGEVASRQIGGAGANAAGDVADSGDRVAVLKQAWDEVFAALDRVETQKARARQTISAADRELTRPKASGL